MGISKNGRAESASSERGPGESLAYKIKKHRPRLQEILANPSLLVTLGEPKNKADWEIVEIVQLSLMIGQILRRISEQAPSVGYEPYLISKGINPIVARGISLLAVKSGTRVAAEEQRLASVIRAIHYIRNPNRNKKALLRRIRTLLSAATETTTIQSLFVRLGVEESHFVRLLQSANTGCDSVFAELAEIARDLPFKSPRGPKIKAASAAHEFMLDGLASINLELAYTWNPVEVKCTDDLSEAARREFNIANFDPRPAYRRLATSSKKGKYAPRGKPRRE